MKHIKKYNNYQAQNEGVKDLVAGGLMALSTMGAGVSSGQTTDKIETTINVEEKKDDIVTDLIVHPNPLTDWHPYLKSDYLSVSFNLLEKAEVNIEIFNILGQVVLKKNEGLKNEGTNNIKIGIDDFYKLKNGVYFIGVKVNDIVYTTRFVLNISEEKKVYKEGLHFIGTDIYYKDIKVAEIGDIKYEYIDGKLVREITYNIVDKKYNYLSKNIIKFCNETKPNYAVEVETKE